MGNKKKNLLAELMRLLEMCPENKRLGMMAEALVELYPRDDYASPLEVRGAICRDFVPLVMKKYDKRYDTV